MANMPINKIRAARLIEVLQSEYERNYGRSLAAYKSYAEGKDKALSAKALRKKVNEIIERMSQLERRYAYLKGFVGDENPLPYYYKCELIDLLV